MYSEWPWYLIEVWSLCIIYTLKDKTHLLSALHTFHLISKGLYQYQTCVWRSSIKCWQYLSWCPKTLYIFIFERERINFPSAWLVYYFLCTYSDLAIIPSCQGQNIFGKHLPIRGIFLLNQPSSTNYIVVLLLTEYHSSTWSQSAITAETVPINKIVTSWEPLALHPASLQPSEFHYLPPSIQRHGNSNNITKVNQIWQLNDGYLFVYIGHKLYLATTHLDRIQKVAQVTLSPQSSTVPSLCKLKALLENTVLMSKSNITKTKLCF